MATIVANQVISKLVGCNSGPKKSIWPHAGAIWRSRKQILLAYAPKYLTRLLNQVRRTFKRDLLEQFTGTFEITHFFISFGKIEFGTDFFTQSIRNFRYRRCGRLSSTGAGLAKSLFKTGTYTHAHAHTLSLSLS